MDRLVTPGVERLSPAGAPGPDGKVDPVSSADRVRVAVVFDPPTESVGVFRPWELPQRFSNGDDLKLADVLPGFSVPVRQFFG